MRNRSCCRASSPSLLAAASALPSSSWYMTHARRCVATYCSSTSAVIGVDLMHLCAGSKSRSIASMMALLTSSPWRTCSSGMIGCRPSPGTWPPKPRFRFILVTAWRTYCASASSGEIGRVSADARGGLAFAQSARSRSRKAPAERLSYSSAGTSPSIKGSRYVAVREQRKHDTSSSSMSGTVPITTARSHASGSESMVGSDESVAGDLRARSLCASPSAAAAPSRCASSASSVYMASSSARCARTAALHSSRLVHSGRPAGTLDGCVSTCRLMPSQNCISTSSSAAMSTRWTCSALALMTERMRPQLSSFTAVRSWSARIASRCETSAVMLGSITTSLAESTSSTIGCAAALALASSRSLSICPRASSRSLPKRRSHAARCEAGSTASSCPSP
mmetsp:Transcript_29620/g.64798  ORF Transcript_29620/g.64798 Transcript_29620/m.64798 type:complete len:394 (+) Transcript_29620:681-1862(+)